MHEPARTGAAIDVGSNSAHLLVAAVGPGGSDGAALALRPLVDESVFLGLGERVGAAGHLGPELRGRVVAALGAYVERARALGAADGLILVIGTEPIRRAGDGARLALELERVCGIPLHVVDHEEEGLLTLLGVTGGRPAAGTTAVVDSGGGSTEIVLVDARGRHEAHGVRLGTASLAAAHLRGDPPTRASVEAMRREAARVLAALPLPADPVASAIAVGGSASNLVKVIPAAREDRRLTGDRLAAALEELLATPAAGLVERHGLNPRRAPLMTAGLAIVEALMARLGVGELLVMEEGIREGAILATALAGAGWRDRLARLATGAAENGPNGD